MSNESENRLSYTRDEYKQLEKENERLVFCLNNIVEFIEGAGDPSFHAMASGIRDIVRQCSEGKPLKENDDGNI